MPSDTSGPDDVVEALSRQAAWLVGAVPGPVSRIRLRHGDASLAIDWGETPGGGAAAGPAAAAAREDAASDAYVRAPLVGTFYRSPEPGAPPFVAVGDVIAVGQHLAIIEAMKLMNPVEADRGGRVVEVLVADATPVEYDQPLFAVEPVDTGP